MAIPSEQNVIFLCCIVQFITSYTYHTYTFTLIMCEITDLYLHNNNFLHTNKGQ